MNSLLLSFYATDLEHWIRTPKSFGSEISPCFTPSTFCKVA